MVNNLAQPVDKVVCPHCEKPECVTETHQMFHPTNMAGGPLDEAQKPIDVSSFMCLVCGYTTTTLNKVGSEMVAQYEEVTAEIIKDLKWIDPNTNLVWYPIVLNFASTGIVFPEGKNVKDWKWRAGLAVDVPVVQRSKYPIPSQPGKFYTKRIDMENSKVFEPNQFYDACKFVGFIKSAD